MNSRLSLEQALEQFDRYLQGQNKAENTIKSYLADLSQFVDFLQDNTISEYVDQVEKLDITEYLATLAQKDLSDTSRRRKFFAVRAFFAYLTEHQFITTDPANSLRPPKIRKKKPRVLNSQEYKAILYEASANPRDLAIVQVFLQTGLRVEELCSLTLSEIDLKAKRLMVRDTKNGEEHYVPLEQQAEEALQGYLARRPQVETNRLFLSKTSRPLDQRAVRYLVEKYVRRAGISKDAKSVSVHTLRHTFASHKAQKGVPAAVLQEWLGHKHISTTYSYIHQVTPNPERLMQETAL